MVGRRLYYAQRRRPSLDDCFFYHCMELPESGEVFGPWDLRPNVDAYLGHVDLAGKRVLEIGPASGYLTFHMERSGADVVAVEVSASSTWDYVPNRRLDESAKRRERADHMRQLRNGFWLAHRELGSRARVHAGNAYELPRGLGTFDVAVMAAVLLHNRDPLRIIENCAAVAETLVITDTWVPGFSDWPVSVLIPTRENEIWSSWWYLSPRLVVQFLEVLGFSNTEVSRHAQTYYESAANTERRGKRERSGDESTMEMFTVVASR